ncbi:MAG: hypothetical protein GF309_02230 [Candidatus Lokiarchaeota archaeon]|nr:hypothetical protein [Candidatus Lokiarchaeota archaeon]
MTDGSVNTAVATETMQSPQSTDTGFSAQVVGKYKVTKFKRLISCIANILHHEIYLQVDGNGISIRQLDLSKAMLVYLTIPADYFYSFEYDQDLMFALDADAFNNAVGKARSRLELVLETQEAEGQLMCRTKDGMVLLKTWEAGDIAKLPELSPDIHASVIAGKFKQMLKKMNGDYFELAVSESDYTLSITDDTTGGIEHVMDRGSGMLSVRCDDETGPDDYACYSVRHVQNMLKLWPNKSRVSVSFSKDKPLILTSSFGELVLAPRVVRR